MSIDDRVKSLRELMKKNGYLKKLLENSEEMKSGQMSSKKQNA